MSAALHVILAGVHRVAAPGQLLIRRQRGVVERVVLVTIHLQLLYPHASSGLHLSDLLPEAADLSAEHYSHDEQHQAGTTEHARYHYYLGLDIHVLSFQTAHR